MNLTLRRVQDTHRAISFAINLTSILSTTAKVWSVAVLPTGKSRGGQLKLSLRDTETQRHQKPINQS